MLCVQDGERIPSTMDDASFGKLVVKEVQQAGVTAPLGEEMAQVLTLVVSCPPP